MGRAGLLGWLAGHVVLAAAGSGRDPGLLVPPGVPGLEALERVFVARPGDGSAVVFTPGPGSAGQAAAAVAGVRAALGPGEQFIVVVATEPVLGPDGAAVPAVAGVARDPGGGDEDAGADAGDAELTPQMLAALLPWLGWTPGRALVLVVPADGDEGGSLVDASWWQHAAEHLAAGLDVPVGLQWPGGRGGAGADGDDRAGEVAGRGGVGQQLQAERRLGGGSARWCRCPRRACPCCTAVIVSAPELVRQRLTAAGLLDPDGAGAWVLSLPDLVREDAVTLARTRPPGQDLPAGEWLQRTARGLREFTAGYLEAHRRGLPYEVERRVRADSGDGGSPRLGPLDDGEFAAVRDAVRGWDQSRAWLVPLLARALGIRIRVLQHPGPGPGTGAARGPVVTQIAGEEDSPPVDVYDAGAGGYHGSAPARPGPGPAARAGEPGRGTGPGVAARRAAAPGVPAPAGPARCPPAGPRRRLADQAWQGTLRRAQGRRGSRGGRGGPEGPARWWRRRRRGCACCTRCSRLLLCWCASG